MITEKARILIRHYTSFFFYLVLILGISLVAAYPRISSTVIKMKREYDWKTFETTLLAQKKVDPREFWKFREFYNIGNFTFNQKGVNRQTVEQQLNNMDIPLESSKLSLPFLTYSSPRFSSLDSLVTTSSLEELIELTAIRLVIKHESKNFVILKKNTTYSLIFILPTTEMKKANGYFEYRDPKVSKMLEGKYWLSISEIKLD